MELKSYSIEKNLNQIRNYPFILLYGENRGLVDVLKLSIRKVTTKKDLNLKHRMILSLDKKRLMLF